MDISNASEYRNMEGEIVTEALKVTVNGTVTFVQKDPSGPIYAEIMRQVEAGELVIQEADTPE